MSTTTPTATQADIENGEPAVLQFARSTFIPTKVRAGIYVAAGIIGVVGLAVGPVIGGHAGEIIDAIGVAAAALGSGVALSHVSG